jgi:hypothetical protein
MSCNNPLSGRPAHNRGRKQVGYWEYDTVIGANRKQVTITVVERKKLVCGHGQGFKQNDSLFWLGDHQIAHAV